MNKIIPNFFGHFPPKNINVVKLSIVSIGIDDSRYTYDAIRCRKA